MKRLMGGAALVCVLTLVPTNSHAGAKSGAWLSSVGVSNVSTNGIINGAPVDCASLSGCGFVRSDGPICAVEGERPAIQYQVLVPSDTTVIATIHQGPDCGDPLAETISGGPFPQNPGINTILINFGAPLDAGTMISIVWTINACPKTACVNYMIGTSPNFCSRPFAPPI